MNGLSSAALLNAPGTDLASPSNAASSTFPPQQPPQPMPRDALAIQSLLASMGLQPSEYQPQVIAQLLEFQQRFTRDILTSAQEFTQHRERSGQKSFLDTTDIDLALDTSSTSTFTSPPPRELLQSLAQTRNSIPLPIVPTREGVHLPPDRYCLMQPNYQIKAPATTKDGKEKEEKKQGNAATGRVKEEQKAAYTF